MSNSSSDFSWDGPCPIESTFSADEDLARSLMWSPLDIKFITIIIPILSAIGVISNGCFLYVIARITSMRTITNFYLGNLAVADILYLIIKFAENTRKLAVSYGIAHNTYDDGPVACVFYAISTTFYLVSMCMITFVAAERYLAICHPLKHRMVASKARAVKLVIVTWLIGLAYSIFISINRLLLVSLCVVWPQSDEFSHLPGMVGYCVGEIIPENIAPLILTPVQALPFFVSLSMTSFMYFKIYRALRKRPGTTAQGADSASRDQSSSNNDKIRVQVARMLLANTVAFFICNFPYALDKVVQMYYAFVLSDWLASPVLWPLIFTMNLLNSIINPIVYNVTNSRYRQAFLQAFLLKNPRLRSSTNKQLQASNSKRVTTSSSGQPTATMDSNI